MASSRRKLDEKHLKILRELGTKSANRTCFDCLQKGPTYINMTIGSFVCTSCSGILRGLNPPHRVKSISMASFTPEEIEQIKSKGNENCQAVWLGLYDGKSSLFPDTKDEHKIRDFMIQKYEKKRFYVDPSVAFKNVGSSNCKSGSSSNASTPGSSDTKSLGSGNTPASSNPSTSVSRPISSLQTAGSSPCLNGFQQSTTLKASASLGFSAMKPSSSLVLLSGLENTSSNAFKNQPSENADPFGFSDVNGDKTTAGFANFDNANIFSNATEDRLFSVPSSVPGTSFLPNSPLKSSPAHYSYSLSSSPACHKLPNPHKFSPSPSSSPEVNPWESLEEDFSAAMPLIPTGELPPTYQPCSDSGKSSNKGVSGSPVIFAAGVSAQFVAPSIDIKSKERLAHLRETRASSLPSSLSESYFKSVQQDFKNSPDTKKEVKFKIYNKEDSKKLPSYDKYFAVEHPLTSAMPLISQEDRIGDSSNVTKSENVQQRSINKNVSKPLGSLERNTSEETLSSSGVKETKKTSSATDLRSKGLSGLFSSSKNIRKVSSYHNISAANTVEIDDNKGSSKKIFSRQLSAISQKMRARLMFDDDLQQPKPRLSSSLPENSPQFKMPNTNLFFANQPVSNSVEHAKQVDPITVTYSKSFTVNKASDFTNTTDGWFADFFNQNYADNNSAFPVSDKSRSFYSDINQGGYVCNKLSASSSGVAEKPLHVPLTNSLDFCNFSNARDNCSSSNANLTCLASPSVAGASNSKSLTTSPHPSFSSNPLTPFSSSSSNPLSSNVVTSSASGGVTASSIANGPEDRYAALKDLDEIFKTQKEVEKPPQNNGSMGLFSTSPPSGNAFGSSNDVHYSQNGSNSANPVYGTPLYGSSPVTGNGTTVYPPSTNSGSAWNSSFNPFSGTQNSNTASPWSSSPAFGTVTQSQANPFAGGIDPNFNSSFGSAMNGTSSMPNTNWANFNSPPNAAIGVPSTKITPNPWSSNASPNPFANSQVPLSGSPFNPFL